MADIENKDDPDFGGYVGVRHYSPALITKIRFLLDLNTDESSLTKSIKAMAKKYPDSDMYLKSALEAVRYMQRNPLSGVGWEENGQFDWRGSQLVTEDTLK